MTRRIFGISIDERFLDHRRRSTSLAAMAGAAVAGGLAEYRLLHEHRIAWEPVTVLLAMVVVKLAAMTWYHFTD